MNGPPHPDLPDDPAVDPIDELLRTRVQAAAPTTTSPSEAQAELVELTPRFRRARQRRQAATAAMSAAAAVVLVVAGAYALGSEDPQRIDTAGDDTSTSVTSSTSTTSTTTTPTSTTVPTSTVAPAPTTVPGTGNGSATTVAPAPVPGALPTTAAPTTTEAVGGTETLTSSGGTATVRWSATSATVLATSPAAGWTLERVEQKSPTRVEVRFRRDGGDSGSSGATIDARVVDGRLQVDAS